MNSFKTAWNFLKVMGIIIYTILLKSAKWFRKEKKCFIERLDLISFFSREVKLLYSFVVWRIACHGFSSTFVLSYEEWVDEYNEYLAGLESGELQA